MAGIAKSTTTPTNMTTGTLYTIQLTKGFHSPHKKPPDKRPNPTADQPHEQCSHPPSHAPEANGANESHLRISTPDRKTAVPNYSAFGICWNPSLTHHAPPNSRDATGTARPLSTHDQSTDQAGTNQIKSNQINQAIIHGCLLDPVKPSYYKSWQE